MTEATDTVLVKSWLAKLQRAAKKLDAKAIAALFGKECYWRDLVALTWNIRTLEGRDDITQMLADTLLQCGLSEIKVDGAAERNGKVVQAWFTFETTVARGRGHVRLKNGMGFTVLTTMQELKGHEERRGPTREVGIVNRADLGRKVWQEERAREIADLGNAVQPYCVIVGGGQGGIALGARLKRLGVSTLIVEKNAKPGDSWRNRYRSLVLHDPVWYDHLPYIPFPDHWPVFCPKDKLGDWLEMYVKVMELNYWGSTACKKAAFDPTGKTWSVQVERDGKPQELRPKHLVFATGSYGPPREPEIKGKERFRGVQYHSSKHTSALHYEGKRCIVLGANSSAHDICADFWEAGADVTMIQRTPTTVVRSETMMDVAFKGLYSEEATARGIGVDKADLMFASVPFRLQADQQRPLYETIAKRDSALIKRLNAAGFMTDYGEDGSGLMLKAFQTGSGYYIDVGCSELIARSNVKVRSKVEIGEIRETSVLLTDGTELGADVIVYATGYLPMNEWLATIISRAVADNVGPNWGYGSGARGDPGPWQGELRNMWKPLKQEALWFHGGNLHLSRHYSHFLALQLKARAVGLATPVY